MFYFTLGPITQYIIFSLHLLRNPDSCFTESLRATSRQSAHSIFWKNILSFLKWNSSHTSISPYFFLQLSGLRHSFPSSLLAPSVLVLELFLLNRWILSPPLMAAICRSSKIQPHSSHWNISKEQSQQESFLWDQLGSLLQLLKHFNIPSLPNPASLTPLQLLFSRAFPNKTTTCKFPFHWVCPVCVDKDNIYV